MDLATMKLNDVDMTKTGYGTKQEDGTYAMYEYSAKLDSLDAFELEFSYTATYGGADHTMAHHFTVTPESTNEWKGYSNVIALGSQNTDFAKGTVNARTKRETPSTTTVAARLMNASDTDKYSMANDIVKSPATVSIDSAGTVTVIVDLQKMSVGSVDAYATGMSVYPGDSTDGTPVDATTVSSEEVTVNGATYTAATQVSFTLPEAMMDKDGVYVHLNSTFHEEGNDAYLGLNYSGTAWQYAMHRLYNPNSGEHFYTSSDSEAQEVIEAGWNDEGTGWTAPDVSNTPVYRLYNAIGGEHHYTMNAEERDNLIAIGWTDEGTGWYSDDAESQVLYREYNPNAFANNHNYTTNKEEHDSLLSAGWQDEGTAWYGLAVS